MKIKKINDIEPPDFTHNMHSQIIGTIDYNIPYTWTFYYPDNTELVIKDVMKFNSMKTGCYVLITKTSKVYVIAPGHKYHTQERTI